MHTEFTNFSMRAAASRRLASDVAYEQRTCPPPQLPKALPGTTAILAMDLAKAFMNVVLTDITEEILEQASEILVLGTTCECVAVTHYNGKPVGDGRPGPMADRLRHLLHDALVTGGVPFLE